MNPAEPTAAGQPATANGADRDRMEVIRFRSQEDCVLAIGALREDRDAQLDLLPRG